MLDLTQQTPDELADIVRAIREEYVKRGLLKPTETRMFRLDCNEVIEWLTTGDEPRALAALAAYKLTITAADGSDPELAPFDYAALDEDERALVDALSPGESVTFGGGSSPLFTIERAKP